MVAGGAGGGGVFVAILIAVSGYSPHESIPISKFIIFITAIATYIINTFWERSSGVIDYALVRAIVPLSLAGTLIGVLINTSANDVVLLVLLSCLLLALMYKTLLLAISRYNERKREIGAGISRFDLSRPAMTPFQLEDSANAPCTSTTVGRGVDI